MKVTIKAVNFTASEQLENFVETKVGKLAHYFDSIIDADVFLKAENSQTSDVKEKIAKIKLDVPGQDLFAEKHASTFEEAVDLATEALERQLVKYKEKIRKN
jgi:putative sigma-54 modulation protein